MQRHQPLDPLVVHSAALLAQRADHPGSLGIAISEAVEVAATNDDTKYALGSVLNHVLLHQTIIGEEAMLQLEMAGDEGVEVGERGRRDGDAYLTCADLLVGEFGDDRVIRSASCNYVLLRTSWGFSSMCAGV